MATTHVATFYSFKGGVGRSLLLANVGVSLARGSRKVLLWDLDVEAPGLHFISGLRPEKAPARGFLEWAVEWQQAGMAPPEGTLLESFLSLPYAVPGIPGLFVLPAFGGQSSFARLYQEVDWQRFTARQPEVGLRLFQKLFDALSGQPGYDHVLLDSRTGITDLGGLLTAALPHATVLVGNYSAQNTEGLLSVYKALQRAVDDKLPIRRQGPLSRVLVASPVPLHENAKRLADRRSVWDSHFERPPDETRVEIPFVPRLLVGEELLVQTEPESPPAQAYQRVAGQLFELRQALVRKQESAELDAVLYSDLSMRRVGARRGGEPRVQSFEERVEHLLKLLGYTVSRSEHADFIAAQRKSGFQQERYLIKCKESRGPLSAAVVADLTDSLLTASIITTGTEPMLVVSGLSNSAREYLREQKVLCFTLKELEQELFDFKPYLAQLRRSYEESTLARSYVDPRFAPGPHEPRSMPALERGKTWAQGKGSRFWVVLGEAGTGKTSLIRRLAYELATAAEQNDGAPVPLYIPLSELSGLMTLETLLQEHLSAAVGWRGDPAILLYLLSLGRIVLLLDGFDEAASRSTLEDQLRQLARPTALTPERPRGNRVLLAARTALFRETRPVDIHTPDEALPSLTPLGQVASMLGAEVDELAGWNQEQLLRFLSRSSGEARAEQWRKLLGRLEEKAGRMTSSPLLVEMLLYAAPEISSREGHLSLGSLFQHFVDRWSKSQSPQVSDIARVQSEFFEQLAREMRSRPHGRMHLRQFWLLAKQISSLEIEDLGMQLRASPFLSRAEPEGYYQFAFKSFEDFFFARHLLRAARERALAGALDTPPLTTEVISFLADLVAMEGGAADIEVGLNGVLGAAYRPQVSENALRLAYEWACGKAGKAGPESRAEMARIVPSGAWLQGADLRKVRLPFAWLQDAHLEGALLDGADLTGASLRSVHGVELKARGSVLDAVDFSGANLEGADFSGSSAFQQPPVFGSANLRNVRLRGTAWQAPDLEGAALESTDLGLARWSARQATRRMESQDLQEASLVPTLQGEVKCVSVSPDGSLLVISSGWSPWVWDAISGRPLMVLVGQEAEVGWVAFSPDGACVAGGCYDGKVALWETASGRLLRSFQAHSRQVRGLAFSPDGTKLATASEDGTTRLWNMGDDKLLMTLEGHAKAMTGVAFSSDGAWLATGSEDAAIFVWEVSTGASVRVLRGHRNAVYWIAFHPSSTELASGSQDGTLRTWDVKTGRQVRYVDLTQGSIQSMAFNGTYLAAITAPGNLLVVNVEKQAVIRRKTLSSSTGSVAFLPGRAASVISATSMALSIEPIERSGAGTWRLVVPWTPVFGFLLDGNVVIGCADGTVWVGDTRTGGYRLAIQTGHDGLIDVAVSPDGKRLVTAVGHGPVQMWSIETGELLGMVSNSERLQYLHFSPDGRYLAGVGEYALVWDLGSSPPQVAFALEGHEGYVEGVAFSPDGRWLATFDAESVKLWNGRTGATVRSLDGLRGSDAYCIAFSPNGRWLAGAGDGGTVFFWDLESEQPVRTLMGPPERIRGLEFSPDGSRLLTGSLEGSVCLWDVQSGNLLESLDMGGEAVVHVAFSRDGRRAMTTGWEGSAWLWDTTTWKRMAEFVKLPRGWATLAGPYAVVTQDADTDRVAVQVGNRFAPLTLLRDECIRPDQVQAALAGQLIEPLRLDLSLADSMLARPDV